MILLPALTVIACRLFALEAAPSVATVTCAVALLAVKSAASNAHHSRERWKRWRTGIDSGKRWRERDVLPS
jgi:hypothetical protein